MDNKGSPYYPPPQGPPPPYSATPGQVPVGFQAQPQQVYIHPGASTSSTTVLTTQPVSMPHMMVVAGGNCPACRTGILKDSFTCAGILWATLFFPIGIICCFLMMERRCTSCGLYFI